jgi:N-acetylglucosamine-6-phosphate deacetylase
MKIADRKGAIKPGMDADIVIFDVNVNVKNTIVNGKVIYTNAD